MCESHSVPGGAAHCWARNNIHFDSGTALFFGLPASRTGPPSDRGSSSSNINHSVSAGHAAAECITATGNAAELAVGALGANSDNPLAAVLTLLDEPLDLISYGPDRTCLVMPQGNFKAQVRINSAMRASTSASLTCGLLKALQLIYQPPGSCRVPTPQMCHPSQTALSHTALTCQHVCPVMFHRCRLGRHCLLELCSSCGVLQHSRSGWICSSCAGIVCAGLCSIVLWSS